MDREQIFVIKRMYCRVLEKLVLKISFFLNNQRGLHFLANSVKGLIRQSESIMRTLNGLNSLETMDNVLLKMYEENELLQNEIYSELINRGYISSVDEFFRINGIDLEHQDYYEGRSESDCDQDDATLRSTRKDKQYESKLEWFPTQWGMDIDREKNLKQSSHRNESVKTVEKIGKIINRNALREI